MKYKEIDLLQTSYYEACRTITKADTKSYKWFIQGVSSSWDVAIFHPEYETSS